MSHPDTVALTADHGLGTVRTMPQFRTPHRAGPALRRPAPARARPGRDPDRGDLRPPAAQARHARRRPAPGAPPPAAPAGRAHRDGVPRAAAADLPRPARPAHQLHPAVALRRLRLPRRLPRALRRQRADGVRRDQDVRPHHRRPAAQGGCRGDALERHPHPPRRGGQRGARGRQQQGGPAHAGPAEHDPPRDQHVAAAGRGLGRHHLQGRRGDPRDPRAVAGLRVRRRGDRARDPAVAADRRPRPPRTTWSAWTSAPS